MVNFWVSAAKRMICWSLNPMIRRWRRMKPIDKILIECYGQLLGECSQKNDLLVLEPGDSAMKENEANW